MTQYSDKLLNKTIEVWQPYYEEPLTREDAREIIENLCGFLTILTEIQGEKSTEGGKMK